jgi:outer membrane protein TolC
VSVGLGALLAVLPFATLALTPDEAVKLALERSGNVTAARLSAEASALERGLKLRPLELRLGHRAFDGLFGTPHERGGVPFGPLDDTYVALGWKLPAPRAIADLVADDAAAEADGLAVAQVERDVATQARTLHARVLALRQEQELAQSAMAIAAQLEEQTRARVSAQAATDLDLHLAALERLDLAGDLEQVTSDAQRAENKLAALIGHSGPLSLERGPELCKDPSDDLERLIARAADHAPRLRALKARHKEKSIEASLAWMGWLPWVDGFLIGWYNEPLDRRDAVRGRLEIALPIFEPLSGRGQAAAIEARRFEALVEDERRTVDADVRSAVQRLASARALVRVFEDGETAIVDRGLSDVTRALEEGHADVMRMAEVQSKAVRARRGLLRARLRCEEAAIELMRIVGDAAR